MSEQTPTKDQSYCDVDNHQSCTGYTEDESDPETCMCRCHDEPFASELAAERAQRGQPYTVVPAKDGEFDSWFVAAIFPGHVSEYIAPGYMPTALHIKVPQGDDVVRAAETAVSKIEKN